MGYCSIPEAPQAGGPLTIVFDFNREELQTTIARFKAAVAISHAARARHGDWPL